MKSLSCAILLLLLQGFFDLVYAKQAGVHKEHLYKITNVDSIKDGTLDTTFAIHGILKYNKNDGAFTQLMIQPDNKIIGASYYDFYISRFLKDGRIDSTFGNGGFIQALNISQGGQVYDMKLQSDGKIVAVGTFRYNWYPEEWRSAIVRLSESGWPDPTFGSGGQIIGSDYPIYRTYTSVAIQPDKKILVAGTCKVYDIDKIIICRYTPEGNLDWSFGPSGKIVTSIGDGNHSCPKMLLLADGKILVSVNAIDQGISHAGILRLLPDGSIDSSFAINGKYLVPGTAYESGFHGNSFFFQSGEKTVLNCSTSAGHDNNLLIRFTPDGLPDSAFGNAGRIQLVDPSYQGAIPQWDDKIIAAQDNFTIVRLTAEGRIDSTFGINGYASTRIDTTSYVEQVLALAIQHGGKILSGGFTFMPNPVYPQNITIYSMTRYFSGLNCPDPVAHYTYLITSDSAVHFQDQSSSVTQWHWDFGDNSYSSEQNPYHLYAIKGKYLTCLDIIDTCGSSQFCDTVYFCDHVKTKYTWSEQNLSVTFYDSSYQAESWHWDFGDGSYSDEQNPEHLFPEYKTYQVCLTAENQCNSEMYCDSLVLKPNLIKEDDPFTLSIYPNPVSDLLKIEMAGKNNFTGNLQLLNTCGTKIFEKEIGGRINIIDTQNISPGVYQLVIISDKNIITQRFIKLKK
jgi:uncharacterized delta-60 repeat protein